MLAALHEPRNRQLWLSGLFVNTARWMDFLTSQVGAPTAAGIGGALAAVLMLPVASRLATRGLSPARPFVRL